MRHATETTTEGATMSNRFHEAQLNHEAHAAAREARRHRITRQERADRLFKRLKDGPAFSDLCRDFTPAEATEQYRRWAETWVLDDLCSLVKELLAHPEETK